jgi:protein O-GlcNAc transferase
MPHSSYLLTLAVSDLFLDTIYYDAHTTASDSLFGSLPILTRPVSQMSSRVASSLNRLLELETILTTFTRKEYVDVALRLSHSREALSVLRRKIQNQIGTNFFNSSLFSRKLEAVYQTMHSLHPRTAHIIAGDVVERKEGDW